MHIWCQSLDDQWNPGLNHITLVINTIEVEPEAVSVVESKRKRNKTL